LRDFNHKLLQLSVLRLFSKVNQSPFCSYKITQKKRHARGETMKGSVCFITDIHNK